MTVRGCLVDVCPGALRAVKKEPQKLPSPLDSRVAVGSGPARWASGHGQGLAWLKPLFSSQASSGPGKSDLSYQVLSSGSYVWFLSELSANIVYKGALIHRTREIF